MKGLYILACACVLTIVQSVFLKSFQLENYNIKKYIKNILQFNFSFGNKNRLKYTKHVQRIILIIFLWNIFLSIFLILFCNNFWIIFSVIVALVIVSPVSIVIPLILDKPIEKEIQKKYIKRAKRKLALSKCKKIAITGSYGKTTTKNFLMQILKTEFDVCATPKSFNTPMGVCKTILENLKETDDFFIVEMGARQKGDIDFLAKFVGVDFGIITPIGNCHLETFGSLANIEKTKYELCENTKGIVIFNAKSPSTKKLYGLYPYIKYLVCEEKSFAFAKNIKTSEHGSSFMLTLDGNKFPCRTKLFGKTNIDNVVVASAMAYLLGMSLIGIKNAIEKLEPTPHRLELIRGRVTIVDDSYNSNFAGFCEALKVIGSFRGRKIVVSPGMVELGKRQKAENERAGKEVAQVADIFIIMNETNKEALFQGARNGGMKRNQIYFAKNRAEQKKLLKEIVLPGDNILFENDFPDNLR